jgi:catechol 2,3-dioxygenase-like lactoylglutathione lyase family enzyme
MSIQINTPGLHHVALRTTDLARSRKFYHELLGFPLLVEAENLCIVGIGNFALAIKGPEPSTLPNDKFSPFRVGLDHIALAANDQKEIDRVASQLKENNVWIEGPKVDPVLGKYYVAFKDPDGIKLELYLV